MTRAALLAAAVLLAGCGGTSSPNFGSLGWAAPPKLFKPARLPDDRVLIGQVRNNSFRDLSLKVGDFKVHDATGALIESTTQFTNSYAHGLYGAFQRPNPLPPDELTRLGLEVNLPGGKTTPITVAFRETKGSNPPYEIDYGLGSLAIPDNIEPAPAG
ncbi:MAG: hypothetical protein QOG62_1024 [Thermoleophilaceae bacterium]|nr:hypothetical protein [Thermoleophilaceae bacterium]